MMSSPLLMTIDQTQPEDVKYFNCLASMITNDEKVLVKLNAGFPWQSIIQQEDFIHQQIGLKFEEETSNVLLLE
jgi:hypothetical protein